VTGPAKIMLIRHAEKSVGPAPAGVNENGDVDKHSLIVRGWQRAGALVDFFENPTRPGISTPTTIFAATISGDPTIDPVDSKSLRPAETVGPLVAKSGAIFRNDIPVGAEGQVIAAIKTCRGVVLVAWEHALIETIARGLLAAHGGDPALVPKWRGDDFDSIYVVTITWPGDAAKAVFALKREGLDGQPDTCPH